MAVASFEELAGPDTKTAPRKLPSFEELAGPERPQTNRYAVGGMGGFAPGITKKTAPEEDAGLPEIGKAIRELVAPTTPYTEKEARRAYEQIPAALEQAGMRLVPSWIAGPVSGMKPSQWRAGLEADLQEKVTAGLAPAIAKPLGETTMLAVEWGYIYPKLFKAVGIAGEAIGKIPQVAKGTKALKAMGGIDKLAEKFPRSYSIVHDVVKSFSKGATVGALTSTPESVAEKLPFTETLKNAGINAVLLGTIVGIAEGFGGEKAVKRRIIDQWKARIPGLKNIPDDELKGVAQAVVDSYKVNSGKMNIDKWHKKHSQKLYNFSENLKNLSKKVDARKLKLPGEVAVPAEKPSQVPTGKAVTSIIPVGRTPVETRTAPPAVETPITERVAQPPTAQGQQTGRIETGQPTTAGKSMDDWAKVSDKALDDAYHYGLSEPGTFGFEANKQSAQKALEQIEDGETDIDEIAAAVHEGWAETARTFEDPVYETKPEKRENRMKLAETEYNDLAEEEKEKDRVVARAILEEYRKATEQSEAEGEETGGRSAEELSALPYTERMALPVEDAVKLNSQQFERWKAARSASGNAEGILEVAQAEQQRGELDEFGAELLAGRIEEGYSQTTKESLIENGMTEAEADARLKELKARDKVLSDTAEKIRNMGKAAKGLEKLAATVEGGVEPEYNKYDEFVQNLEKAAKQAGLLTDSNEEKYRKIAIGIAQLDNSKFVKPEHAAEAIQLIAYPESEWTTPKTEVSKVTGKTRIRSGPGSPIYERNAKVYKAAGISIPKPAELEKPAAKQLWEMTRGEVVWEGYVPDGSSTDRALKGRISRWKKIQKEAKGEGIDIDVVEKAIVDETARYDRAKAHREAVQQALSENLPVPREVLEEYKGEKWAQEALAKPITQAEGGAKQLWEMTKEEYKAKLANTNIRSRSEQSRAGVTEAASRKSELPVTDPITMINNPKTIRQQKNSKIIKKYEITAENKQKMRDIDWEKFKGKQFNNWAEAIIDIIKESSEKMGLKISGDYPVESGSYYLKIEHPPIIFTTPGTYGKSSTKTSFTTRISKHTAKSAKGKFKLYPWNIKETLKAIHEEMLLRTSLSHAQIVQQAVAEGRPVPREVLEEYKGEKWADEELEKQAATVEGTVEEIIAAARKPVPNIVEVVELKGTDGKWYSVFGFPSGVQSTGERRTVGFTYQNPEGTTYGIRGKTRQELIDRHEAQQDKAMEEFRTELENKKPEELAESAKFWRENAAQKERLKPTAERVPVKKTVGTWEQQKKTELKKYKDKRFKTANDEIQIKRIQKQLKENVAKWKPGQGVGWRQQKQINRGLRIVEVYPETHQAKVQYVKDVGVLADYQHGKSEIVDTIDLIRDNKFDTPAPSGTKKPLTQEVKEKAEKPITKAEREQLRAMGMTVAEIGKTPVDELRKKLGKETPVEKPAELEKVEKKEEERAGAGQKIIGTFTKSQKDSFGSWQDVEIPIVSIAEPVNVRGKVTGANWSVKYTTPSTLGKTGVKEGTEYFRTKTEAEQWIEKVEKKVEGEVYEKPKEEAITEPKPGIEAQQGKAAKLEPTGTLDPTKPEDAEKIVELHKEHISGRDSGRIAVGGIFETEYSKERRQFVVKSVEYSANQVDQAYRTLQNEVESPQEDVSLFAMPGKEKELEAIGKKMARMKALGKRRTTAPSIGKVRHLPKAKTKKADFIKAIQKATAKEESRYAINGVYVEGDNLVATDGRRLFVAKGKWGKDGIYTNQAALKQGLLGKADKTGLKFPAWKDIVPDYSKEESITIGYNAINNDLPTVWRRIHQAASMTSEESKGITVILNKDGSLGFAAAAPEVGHTEINVNPGGKILGAVNPQYLLDAIGFHVIRGDRDIEFYFPYPDRPILITGTHGTKTVIMPVNAGEPSEALKKELGKEDPGVQLESPMGGFVGGRPATAKVSAIVKESMKTGSKNADSFLRRTKGFVTAGRPGTLRRVASNIIQTFREFHYLPDLPKTSEFADVREAFRHTEEISKLATNNATEKMRWAIEPVKGTNRELRKRMQAVEMKLIADDLSEDVEKGLELPPKVTAADVGIMKTRADELYAKYPTVREAYDRLRQVTKEIGDMLVEEGMLKPEQAKEFYFPHRVIKYLRNEDGFFGIPSRKPAEYKKSYLKQRKGGYDYSTDIMARLVEHWTQVIRDVEYRRFLEKTLKQEQKDWFRKEYPEWKEFTKTEDGRRVRNLVPEGYKEVTVLPGRYYYQAHGVTEDMAKALMEQDLASIEELLDEETAGKVRKVLALGKKRSYIVREPIARQIHNMPTMAISRHPAYLAVKGFNTFVKGQILFNPLYSLPFHVTNFTGDAHKNLVAMPSALRGHYLGNYWKEIIAAHKGEKSHRFELAQKYGVIGSGWIGVDIPKLKAIMPEIEKAEISGAGKHLTNKVKLLWNLSKKIGSGREDWLRYALFDRLMDLQEQGKNITKYAIKDSFAVKGISDPEVKAAKIARDIAGDYTAIGKTGRILSDIAVPFYRWMHLNLPWWPRMMKEYAKKGQAGRLVYALMAAALPYILSTIWNYSDEDRRKYERKLPYWKRWNFHIIGLRGKKMYYIPLPLDDVANFIGLPENILDYQRYQRGMIDMPELLKRIAINSTYEPGMSIINAVGGAAGVVRDLVGVQTYPDIRPWLETRPGRKILNVSGDIFGSPAQLGKALQYEGVEIDPDTGDIILGPKTKDLLNRSWMGIRPYSIDEGRTIDMWRKSTYKRTNLKEGQIAGEPHKGKRRRVDSLEIQLEGAG